MGNKKRAKQALCLLLAPVRNKRASTLVIVVVSFAVLMIVGVSLLAVVSYNHKNAADYHRKQQAEYTARGVMEAIVEAFDKPTTGNGKIILEKVEALGVGGVFKGDGDMADANMGKYKVELTLVKPEEIHAVVIATYQGMSYKVSAHFEKNTGGNTLDPFEFLFFSNDKGFSVSGGGSAKAVLDGRAFGGKTVGNWDDIHFKDKVITVGSLTAENCIFDGDLVIVGGFTDRGGCTYNAKVYYPGGPTSGNPTGPDGTPPIKAEDIGFDDQVQYHQRTWSPIEYEFVGDKNSISFNGVKCTPGTYSYVMPDGANLVYNGGESGSCMGTDGSTITYDGAKITFANGDYIDRATRTYVESMGYRLIFSDLNLVSVNNTGAFVTPTPSSFSSTVSLANASSISAGAHRLSGNATGGVTLDTSGGDIHLFTDSDVDIRGNLTITGDNNVYFHLTSSNTFKVGDGATAGLNSNEGIQLYVEGTDANLELDGAAKFRGYAYIPNGKYVEKGSGTTVSGNKIEGSITSDDIGIKGGNTYKYVKWHKDSVFKTPIQNNFDPSKPYFIYPPTSGSSGDNWTLIGYY